MLREENSTRLYPPENRCIDLLLCFNMLADSVLRIRALTHSRSIRILQPADMSLYTLFTYYIQAMAMKQPFKVFVVSILFLTVNW